MAGVLDFGAGRHSRRKHALGSVVRIKIADQRRERQATGRALRASLVLRKEGSWIQERRQTVSRTATCVGSVSNVGCCEGFSLASLLLVLSRCGRKSPFPKWKNADGMRESCRRPGEECDVKRRRDEALSQGAGRVLLSQRRGSLGSRGALSITNGRFCSFRAIRSASVAEPSHTIAITSLHP